MVVDFLLIKIFHLISSHLITYKGSRKGWTLSQLTISKRQGKPWISSWQG